MIYNYMNHKSKYLKNTGLIYNRESDEQRKSTILTPNHSHKIFRKQAEEII